MNIKDSIVFEDENLLVINKPRGLLLQQDGDESHESLDKLVSDYLKATAMHQVYVFSLKTKRPLMN